jgi:hypothetical protein
MEGSVYMPVYVIGNISDVAVQILIAIALAQRFISH